MGLSRKLSENFYFAFFGLLGHSRPKCGRLATLRLPSLSLGGPGAAGRWRARHRWHGLWAEGAEAPAPPFHDEIPPVVRLQLQRTGLATVFLPRGGPDQQRWIGVPMSDSSVSFGAYGDICPTRVSVGLSSAGPRVHNATGLQQPLGRLPSSGSGSARLRVCARRLGGECQKVRLRPLDVSSAGVGARGLLSSSSAGSKASQR